VIADLESIPSRAPWEGFSEHILRIDLRFVGLSTCT